ncbi:uncharacterized protein LOC142589772 isoform X2 [Dermacentor variabilis]|uniref:uncharacterized protein LOC142589772 isoform X2 n=1 Tax=Dermacentor variabilis TaxID=34621 RepID=UPI003F5C2711
MCTCWRHHPDGARLRASVAAAAPAVGEQKEPESLPSWITFTASISRKQFGRNEVGARFLHIKGASIFQGPISLLHSASRAMARLLIVCALAASLSCMAYGLSSSSIGSSSSSLGARGGRGRLGQQQMQQQWGQHMWGEPWGQQMWGQWPWGQQSWGQESWGQQPWGQQPWGQEWWGPQQWVSVPWGPSQWSWMGHRPHQQQRQQEQQPH